MKNTKYLKYVCAGLITAALPLLTLSARDYGGGGGGGHGTYGEHGGVYGQEYNHGYDDNYGAYYGGNPDFVVNPYPAAGSQPGMSDDSDALYQSYLQHNGNGY
jgi:hypothetical protein